jgi:glycosyltransferase involved in cell wall biosynthesis
VVEPSQEEARSSGIELSVVIPCLDEAETIAACVVEAEQALIASEASGEVVVVDNGSTDGSEHLAAAAGAAPPAGQASKRHVAAWWSWVTGMAPTTSVRSG